MSAQIIKRYEEQVPDKETIEGRIQVSYNSDGHLVVRYIDYALDTLIVFDVEDSDEILFFINQITDGIKNVIPRLKQFE